MRTTVIVDNIGLDGIPGEWGLSIYIEYKNKKILLDAGQTDLLTGNAGALGIDLSVVDMAVLSHGHYDHGGGMEAFFKANKTALFYLRNGCGENCYVQEAGGFKYIGIPQGILKAFPDRFAFADGLQEISEGVYLLPHTTEGLEKNGLREKMYLKTGDEMRPDNFCHEQSLVFDTAQGLVIFNSCSHGGAANIIREVREAFPDKKVYGMIGGFHLYNKTEEEIRAFADLVSEAGVDFLCTGHCTGDTGYQILKEVLGEKLHKLHVGLVMTFEEAL